MQLALFGQPRRKHPPHGSTPLDRNEGGDTKSQRAVDERNQEGDGPANLARRVGEGDVVGGSLQMLTTDANFLLGFKQ